MTEVNGVTYEGDYEVRYRPDFQPSEEIAQVVGANEMDRHEMWGEPTLVITHPYDHGLPGIVYPDELFPVKE